MDKETLSNYGWIVICTLVLAVMIALATPFGEFIRDGVWSTTNGLNDTLNKNMEIVGLNGSDEDIGEDDNFGDDIDNDFNAAGLRFGQEYLVNNDGIYDQDWLGYSFTFYADGSAKLYYCGEEEMLDAGAFTYSDTEILPTDPDDLTLSFEILDNGTSLKLYNSEETGYMTLILKSTIPTPVTPVQFDKRYVSEDGLVATFYADGSAKFTDLMETSGEYYPAFAFSYEGTRIYSEIYEVEYSVSEDGKTVFIEDVVLQLCEIEHLIQFEQKYVCVESDDPEVVGQYVIFYENGSLAGSLNQTGTDATEPGGLKYVVGYFEGELAEVVCIRIEYNGKVTYFPLIAAYDSESIVVGDDIWVLESAMQ
jgi:hypothetical protein